LVEANLEAANLTESELRLTNFRGANLAGANFYRSSPFRATIDLRWKEFLKGQTFRTDKMYGSIHWEQ